MMVLLLALWGCTEEPECSEEVACPFGSVCDAGVCVEIPCSTSDQCRMNEYCEDRVCVEGCAEDGDCPPGEVCDVDAHTCEARGCRSTRLDCDYKEFCNEANGECYEAGGYYCRSCADNDDCGGNDNLCLSFGTSGQYCGVTCSTSEDCPAGFDCSPIGDINGNIVSYQCLTYCWLYDEDADGLELGEAPADLPPLNPLPVESAVCESAP